MIIGVGMDLLDIARVERMLEGASGRRFLERVLTAAERELAEARRPRLAEFVAGRFAAKEAVGKALGCGIGRQAGFQDMELLPGAEGKPECQLSAEALERLGFSAGGRDIRVHVSITHTASLAAAYAVIERLEDRRE